MLAPTIYNQPADPTEQPTYHMIDLHSFILTKDARTRREGNKCFRNSRDLAKEARDGAIARANKIFYIYKKKFYYFKNRVFLNKI